MKLTGQKKHVVFWFCLILGVCLCLEGISWGFLWFLKETKGVRYVPQTVLSKKHRAILTAALEGKSTYLEFSRQLGWTIQKNGRSKLYRSNSAGLRGKREYAVNPPAGSLRIAAFGDSYTHSSDVSHSESWPARLEALSSRIECMNFGVPGFGLDQSYLRYVAEGASVHPHIVFIGFMSENIFRSVSVFRRFYWPETSLPLTKPRYILEGGSLTLLPNPFSQLQDYRRLLENTSLVLRQLGKYDHFYRKKRLERRCAFSSLARAIVLIKESLFRKRVPSTDRHRTFLLRDYYTNESEAFQVTTKIFDRFVAEVESRNAMPIIILFPKKKDIEKYFLVDGDTWYRVLKEYLVNKGYVVIDMIEAFPGVETKHDLTKLFKRGHYSSLANKLVARYLFGYLTSRGLIGGGTEDNGRKRSCANTRL